MVRPAGSVSPRSTCRLADAHTPNNETHVKKPIHIQAASAFLLCVLLAVPGLYLSGGAVLAKDLVYRPDKPVAKPAAPATKTTNRSAPSGSDETDLVVTPLAVPACLAIAVTVDQTKPDGRTWDIAGKWVKPDILVSELTTGVEGKCKDTFTCSIQAWPDSGTFDLTIIDDDFDKDDPIGQGSCAAVAGGQCRLGAANIRLSTC